MKWRCGVVVAMLVTMGQEEGVGEDMTIVPKT
jgi:hypothetical protein